jgi:hypothetical protein
MCLHYNSTGQYALPGFSSIYFGGMNLLFKMMKIKGLSTIDDIIIDCQGSITIHFTKGQVVYATWCIFDSQDRMLAAKSRSYFFDSDNITEDAIIDKVFKDILKYRIGRKKVFFDICVVE